MAEGVWSGLLRLSLVCCPVRLIPASEIGDRIFEAPAAGSPVAIPQVIEVAQFIPRDRVDRQRLETGYYIHPGGEPAADTLDALRLAMQRGGRDAIAYAGLEETERMVLIEPHGDGLMLTLMRRPHEVQPPGFRPRPESEVPAEMVEIAEALISRRLFDGDPNALHDQHEARLSALIAARTGAHGASAQGPETAAPGGFPLPPQPEPATVAEGIFEGAILAGSPDLQPIPAAPSSPPEPVPGVAPEDSIPSGGLETGREPEADALPAAEGEAPRHELGVELLLHMTGLGDRRFAEPGWAGSPGSGRHIEAISIRPLERFEPSAVEFRAFARDGRATAWVSNGDYAGTSGRDLPLTGFAVRAAAELRDRLDLVYEGWFVEGGGVGPRRNGEICTSSVPDDPLEAVRVSIVERPSEPPEEPNDG